jgi:single-stranded DNA-binding protein
MIIKQGNNRIVTGKVTRDAEIKLVGEKQTARCTFGVAAANYGEDTVFANIVAWRDKAEAAAILKKGDYVAVFGKEKSREYNGKTYYDLEADVIIPSLEVLLAALNTRSSRGASAPPPAQDKPNDIDMAGLDDLPF